MPEINRSGQLDRGNKQFKKPAEHKCKRPRDRLRNNTQQNRRKAKAQSDSDHRNQQDIDNQSRW
ncbi:MAG: hypothetical protein O2820_22930 [Planctomycetota bacterium]|nr:hypothetical protein [Planctomycetota bacterium]MDA1252073.1 hypothetical protein [Planctomycetota bacterium]